jgi:hypothetical protein
MANLALVLLAIFLTKAEIYAGANHLIPVRPWTAFLIAASVIVVPSFGLVLKRNATTIGGLIRCLPIIAAFSGVVFLSLICALWDGANYSEGFIYLFMPELDLLVFMVGLALGIVSPDPKSRRWGTWFAFAAGVGSIFVDVVRPETFSPFAARAAGLAVNPNSGAVVAVAMGTACLDWIKPRVNLYSGLICAITAAAVLFTFSRAGVFLLVTAGLLYIARAQAMSWARFARSVIAAAATVAAVISLMSILFADSPAFVADTQRARLFRGDSADVVDFSFEERVAAISTSFMLIGERPFLGWGTGYVYAMRIGPHNMYLARWIDNGWFGELAYLWLLSSIVFTNIRLGNWEGVALASVTAVDSLFCHNVLEDRTLLLLIGISSGAAGARCSRALSSPLRKMKTCVRARYPGRRAFTSIPFPP